MVVIGLISILTYFGLNANIANLFSKNALSTTAQSLHGALNYARNLSIDRGGRNVIFCTPNDTETDCNATPNWANGWMVISPDNNGNNDIRVFPSKFGNTSGNSIVKSGNAQLAFRNGGANQNTTFVLCNSEGMGPNAREVIVTMTGRVRTVKGNDPNRPQPNC